MDGPPDSKYHHQRRRAQFFCALCVLATYSFLVDVYEKQLNIFAQQTNATHHDSYGGGSGSSSPYLNVTKEVKGFQAKTNTTMKEPVESRAKKGRNSNKTTTTTTTVYVTPGGDRSGSVIQRLVQSYAYAYHHGYAFGGVVPAPGGGINQQRKELNEALLREIGLDNVFQFLETTPAPSNHTIILTFYKGMESVEGLTYAPGKKFFEYLTPSFVMYLQQLRRQAHPKPKDDPRLSQKDRPPLQVAIHVRRGDSSPCGKWVSQATCRYYPNWYHLKVLDTHLASQAAGQNTTTNVNVTVFSESNSFESFDDFRERGYMLDLDGPLGTAWRTMIEADVLICSPGSKFTFLPSLLNSNTVYLGRMEDARESLPQYKPVNSTILVEAIYRRYALRMTCNKTRGSAREPNGYSAYAAEALK